jgi:hypothetical protein
MKTRWQNPLKKWIRLGDTNSKEEEISEHRTGPMEAKYANGNIQYMAILRHLQSLHPQGNEITLRFDDKSSMEAFKLAALNSLLAEKHSQPSQRVTPKKPVDSSRRENLESELYGQRPSKRAAILCRNAIYWRHLKDMLQNVFEDEIDEIRARRYIYKCCNIQNRRELDYNPCAMDRFHSLIENPFLAWLSNHS